MREVSRRAALAAGAAMLASAGMSEAASKKKRGPVTPKPLIIAHRGASGERPEHTMASYALAIAQGADFIEPDLVLTKDGVLVCRHENEISSTTDVANQPVFAARRTTKTIDGASITGWFTEDFTLAELKTLRCKERLPELRPQNTAYDGKEPIPTFAEVLALARKSGAGVYPETKHPSYFDSINLSHDAPLLAALRQSGWASAAAPVFIQSFEVGNLKRLRAKTKVRLTQLMAAQGGPADVPGQMYQNMLATGLADVRAYADAIGVEKVCVVLRNASDISLASTDLVARAHQAKLAVHVWTFRAENYFLPAELRRGDPKAPDFLRRHGDLAAELGAFFKLGVDGVFSDFPASAVSAVRAN